MRFHRLVVALLSALSLVSAAYSAAPCTSYEVLHSFPLSPRTPYKQAPVLAADGSVYFTTTAGGETDSGTIAKVSPAGVMSAFVSLSGAGGPFPGSLPETGMTLGPDGALYGTTRRGAAGAASYLSLFRCTTAGAYQVLYTRTASSSAIPSGALYLASDGSFYGLTRVGGASSKGSIYRLKPDVAGNYAGTYTFTELAAFTGRSSTITPLEGESPEGELVERNDSGTPYLYGVVRVSGNTSTSTAYGKIFKFALPAASATSVVPETVVQFGGDAAPQGAGPSSGLMKAPDGTLYGAAENSNVRSVIYKITPAGAYSVVYDLEVGVGSSASALATPLLAPDGFLYFPASFGTRRLMKVKTDGTGAAILLEYSGTVPPPAGRWNVFSSFQLVRRPDGKLIGLCDDGKVSSGPDAGRDTYGSLFAFNPANNSYQIIKDLLYHETGSAPASPRGGLIEEGTYFYGITYEGGAATGNSPGLGSLYRRHKTTSALDVLYSFGVNSSTAPAWPSGTLRADVGPVVGHRYLYGNTTASNGAVWRYNINDGTMTVLAKFSGTSAPAADQIRGSNPTGQLEPGGDGYLYGVTNDGGLANGAITSRGTIYRVRLSDGAVESITNFNQTTATGAGLYPLGGLTAAPLHGTGATVLYGTTSSGSSPSNGGVFYFTPGTNPALTYLFQFTGASGVFPGQTPRGKLLASNAGGEFALYGVTETGGTASSARGTAWRYSHKPAGAVFTTLANFSLGALPFKGYTPAEGLTLAADGRLYGTTARSAENLNLFNEKRGTIYRLESLTASTQTPVEVAAFDGVSSLGNTPGDNAFYGSSPNTSAPLVSGLDGHLYGVTANGGFGEGVIYRVKVGSEIETPIVSNVTKTSAQVRANVLVNNETVTVRFTWWPTASPTATSTREIINVTTSGPVTAALSPLILFTNYTVKAEVIGCVTRQTATVTFTTLNSVYGNWKLNNFGTNASNPTIAGDDADPDNDGIPNLLEFMTDTHPSTKNRHPLMLTRGMLGEFYDQPDQGDPTILFNYWRRTNADEDEQLMVQYSTDLDKWLDLPSGFPGVENEDYFFQKFAEKGLFFDERGNRIDAPECTKSACPWIGYFSLPKWPEVFLRLKATR